VPSISMIDHVEFEEPGSEARGQLKMKLGGPLDLDRREKYAGTITIKFVIIQGPERTPGQQEGHDPAEDRHIRGSSEASPMDEQWEAAVMIENPSEFRSGEARGVAMAVMEQAGGYAYETLTWCDFLFMPELKAGEWSRLKMMHGSGSSGPATMRTWESSTPRPTPSTVA
jgi:hypothetical protein